MKWDNKYKPYVIVLGILLLAYLFYRGSVSADAQTYNYVPLPLDNVG